MTNRANDKHLAQKYLDGDQRAFKEIGFHIEHALLQWSNRLGYMKDDVVSDVHFHLLNSLRDNSFDFRCTLKTYINVVTKHRCIDVKRWLDRRNHLDVYEQDLPSAEKSPIDPLIDREEAFLFFKVVRAAKKECIKLWRLYAKEGKTCPEIGGLMGRTDVYIRRKLWECRDAAKKHLAKLRKIANGSQS